jgi:hypothetical protein
VFGHVDAALRLDDELLADGDLRDRGRAEAGACRCRDCCLIAIPAKPFSTHGAPWLTAFVAVA